MEDVIDKSAEAQGANQDDFISVWYLSELVRWWKHGLLPVRQNQDIEYYCSFQGAYDVVSFFRDIPVLVHGPSGCTESFSGTKAYPGASKVNKPRSWSTNLVHDDVVFGASKKLQAALLKLDQELRPPLIVVLTNCCADIIGEDVKAAINKMSSQINADVIQVETGGCSGYGFRKGADLALEQLFEYVAEKRKHVEKPATPSINIFTKRLSGRPADVGEVDELERLLGKIGIKVNTVVRLGASYEDLLNLPHATANASLCHVFGDGPMQKLNTLFGQPYAETLYPIGYAGTVAWVKQIAAATGVDPAPFLNDPEVLIYRDKIQRAREKYQGRKAFIWMPGEKGLGMARFAHELGMIPYLFTISYQAVDALERSIELLFQEGIDLPTVLTGKEIIMRAYQDGPASERPILFMSRKFWGGELPTVATNCFGDITLGFQGIDLLLRLLEETERSPGGKDYALFNRFIENRTQAHEWKLNGPAFNGEEKYYERKKQVLERKRVVK